MASLTYAPGERTGRLGQRVFAWFGGVGARLAATRKARRDFEALLGASDYILDDIGLTRGDLERALASPVWVDPSERLLRRRS